MDLRDIGMDELDFVMERLNHRPRKMLAFKPPHDIFVKCESNGFACVALGT
jgi:IS30 family transposase